ncbi:hypothetical protein K1719_041968 [Acacia pycnantha]|nr:hypothetical protein K1719_041968 [Acacia pycnantha]
MSKSFFSDVDDSKDTWSVVAKVLRKWVVRKKAAPYPIWKIGMILVDEMESTIEVSATHKNLILKLLDDPKEEMVYNFQNFEVVENDDKYRVTSNLWKFNFHTYTFIEESDVVINKEAYNFKPIVDIRTGSIPDTGLIDVIGFLQAFGRLTDQRRESDIIKRLNLSIADQKLSQDSVSTQMFIQISNAEYPTYSAESLLTFHTRVALSEISNLDKESTASRQTAHTSSQTYVIEDDINNLTQLTTPQDANTKRKNIADDVPILCGDLGIAEMCTPKLSSTKPVKNIKKEK